MNWYKIAQQQYQIEGRLDPNILEEYRSIKSEMNRLSKEYADLYLVGEEDENSDRKSAQIMERMKELDKKINEFEKVPIEELKAERQRYMNKQKDEEKQTIQRYKNIHKIGPQLEDYARKHFPLTDNINLAGYIMSDGDMLNFSYRGDKRDKDHRYIKEAFPEDTPIDDMTDGMNQFMIATKAIRVNAHRNFFSFDIKSPPTKSQMRIILKCLKSGTVEISFNSERKEFSNGEDSELAEFAGFTGYLY